jgi:hypothetical protein
MQVHGNQNFAFSSSEHPKPRAALSGGCLNQGLSHGTLYVVLRRAISIPTFLQIISEEAWLGHHLRTSNDHRFIVGVP